MATSDSTEQSDTGWLEIDQVRVVYDKCLTQTNLAFKKLWEKTKLVEQEMNLVSFILDAEDDNLLQSSVYDTLRESVKHDVISCL